MNARIRELAEEARDYVADAIELGFPKDQVDDIRDEKFAELIVRECIQVTLNQRVPVIRIGKDDNIEDRYFRGHNGAIADAVFSIKQHFGVKDEQPLV